MLTSIPGTSDATWAVFLSRAAALKALVTVALVVAFGLVISGAGTAPLEAAELIGASQNPAAYRVFAALDTLVWFGFGAVLLGFAALGSRQAPVRALCVAALAVAQVVGMIGGYLRLVLTTTLATRYAAAGADDRLAAIEEYQALFAIIAAHFGLGQVLYGVAFLLVAGIALRAPAFPRLLAYLIGGLGAYSLANQVSVVISGGPLWAPLFFLFLALTVVMDVAVAATFWRGTSPGAAGTSDERAGIVSPPPPTPGR